MVRSSCNNRYSVSKPPDVVATNACDLTPVAFLRDISYNRNPCGVPNGDLVEAVVTIDTYEGQVAVRAIGSFTTTGLIQRNSYRFCTRIQRGAYGYLLTKMPLDKGEAGMKPTKSAPLAGMKAEVSRANGMIIHWSLGNIARSGCILQEPYVVVKNRIVFDTDSQGWDLGIQSGMMVEEIKWQYPQARWIPWRLEDYQAIYNQLLTWLTQYTQSYHLEDVREGYWQQSAMHCDEWRQLVKEFVPKWAGRMRMGVSVHPLLSRWISQYGDRYPQWVEKWQENQQIAYVLQEQNTNRIWKELPLTWISYLSGRTLQEWNKRGWNKIGDIPYSDQIVQDQKMRFPWRLHRSYQPIRMEMGFEEPLQYGFPELIRHLATEIGNQLQINHQGSRYLRVVGQSNRQTVMRERTWSLPTRSVQQVVLRFLSLGSTIPLIPLERVILEAHQPETLNPEQMMWWNSGSATHADIISSLSAVSRRDQLLQHWDPWRRLVPSENSPEYKQSFFGQLP